MIDKDNDLDGLIVERRIGPEGGTMKINLKKSKGPLDLLSVFGSDFFETMTKPYTAEVAKRLEEKKAIEEIDEPDISIGNISCMRG